MIETDSATREKMPLDGIRLSHELVLFNLRGDGTGNISVDEVLQHIAEAGVNIPFLTIRHAEGDASAAFCVAHGDFERVSGLPVLSPDSGNRFETVPHTGALTLYPHRSRLPLLFRVIDLLDSRRFPIHGIASSLSAVTVITDHRLLDDAAALIDSAFALPDNRTPMLPKYRIAQL